MMTPSTAIAPVLASVLALASCATSGTTHADLSRSIAARTGGTLRPRDTGTAFSRPPGVTERDGLSERDAVALALWNNAALQADLAQLDLSRADLTEASLLPNPLLSLVFPLGPRQLAASLAWPVDVLWQRPRRIAAAERELARVGHGLVQNGLDVVRDVRVTYVDGQLASERESRLREAAAVLRSLRELADGQREEGDLAPTDVDAIDGDLAAALGRAAQAGADRAAVRARLGRLTGLGAAVPEDLAVLEVRPRDVPSMAALSQRALAARPDVRAAEVGVEVASERLGWERSRAWGLIALLDAGVTAGQGFGASPGLRAELPLFNRNQGGISRAEAELTRASWRYVAARMLVDAEVATAHAAYRQSVEALRIALRDELPATERVLAQTRARYEVGDVSWFAVLDAQRRSIDARLRAAEARAGVARAVAELDRSVGGALDVAR